MGGLIMNENINLVEILKDCKKGTKFYSSAYGDLQLNSIGYSISDIYPIVCTKFGDSSRVFTFTVNGKIWGVPDGECVLFPSEEQRDWSKFIAPVETFNPKDFKPFDKVLIRDWPNSTWRAALFSHISNCGKVVVAEGSVNFLTQVIPYNKETHTLIGTTNDCPDFYKWWEK